MHRGRAATAAATGSPDPIQQIRKNRMIVAAAAAVLFALVYAVHLFGDVTVTQATALLYTIPIALLATAWGVRGGLLGAVVATGLLVLFYATDRHALDAGGYGTRITAFLLLGAGLGWVVDRLRTQQAYSRGLIESSLDALATIDPQGTITDVNHEMEALTGRSREELVGAPFAERFTDPARAAEGVRLVLERGTVRDYELTARSTDGTETPVSYNATTYERDGQLEGVFAAARDVTERKRAEEERGRLAAIVEGSSDAIFAKTLDGVILTWNPGAERIYGYAPEEALGEPVTMLIPPEHHDEEQRILATVGGGGRVAAYDTQRIDKDGRRTDVSVAVSPIRDRAGQVIGASTVARDVTERKRAEEEIRALNVELESRVDERTAELQAANRDLEGFAYSVSHDLRAPLRAIDGFSQVLLEDYSDRLDDEGRHDLDRVRAGAQRMGMLIDDILNLSRTSRQVMKGESVDLSALSGEVAAELRDREPDRDVTVEIEPGMTARADPRLARILLQNLIGNAFKFTAHRPDPHVEVGSFEDEEGVPGIFVRDNGVGFDMTHADQLFRPFHRLHRAEEFNGSGIGLALVQRIARRHGGVAWAQAREGEGATFYFTLQPGARVPEDARAAREEEVPAWQ